MRAARALFVFAATSILVGCDTYATAFLVNELKIAMRNAMILQEDVVLLMRIDPIRSVSTDLENLGKTMGGTNKYKALVGKSTTAWQDTKKAFDAAKGTCFVAGTLVHTINGLVPIEQIKVGDLVLSKPENGGEISYKPVTKTFEHDYQEVYLVCIGRDRDIHGNKLKNQIETDYNNFLVTGNHPFYERDDYYGKNEYNNRLGGWKKIERIGIGYNVEILDGVGVVYINGIAYHSNDPGVAFAPYQDPRWEDHGGRYFDYLPKIDFGTLREARTPPRNIDRYEVPMTVYNIEVQDNHTYYVGTIGVWVHNKNVSVLNEKQVVALTGEESGKLHMSRESPICQVSCDHIPRRSWPLFRARAVLRSVIESMKQESVQ